MGMLVPYFCRSYRLLFICSFAIICIICGHLLLMKRYRKDEQYVQHLPSCLIIGARKGGTRALLQFISIHPRIRIVPQELHFFDNDTVYALGIDWYRSQMPFSVRGKNMLTIEKTPAYLVSPVVPERVHKFNSNMKLILVVREPVVRTISDFTQVMHSKISKGKPVVAFESVVFDTVGRVRRCYKPIRNSLYADHLQRWLSKFPGKQLHIVDGDRLITEPLEELKSVEKFLQLEPYIRKEHFYFSHSKGFYCYRHPVDGNVCLGDSKGRSHVQISNKTRATLRIFFHDYNQRFFAMVNRTFKW